MPASLSPSPRFLLAACLALAGCGEDALPLGGEPASDMGSVAPQPDLHRCELILCGAACVDTATDPMHCGACDKQCSASEDCKNGVCVLRPCTKDGDCNDGIGCTLDTCVAGKCTFAAGPNSGPTACPMNTECDVAKGCVPVRPLVGPNLCAQDPPMGATLAPPPPKYKGVCPKLVAATMGESTIVSSGASRTFLLAIPKNLDPKEKLPVLFLWHWLGGSAGSFYKTGDVQNAVDQQRFLAVIPNNKKVNGNSDLQFKWPFTVLDSQARMDEEARFFDDLLACVAEQFNVNKECVATAGVSAGALWTDQLVQLRNGVLSSGISLSGGTGGLAVKPWNHPPRHLPMLVLWGGPTDICIVINFQDASRDLEKGLKADGSLTLECVHNCGHGVPPVQPPEGISQFAPIWQFAFDHPYWLRAGESPYVATGLPREYPDWCALGAGNAVPRQGACGPPGC